TFAVIVKESGCLGLMSAASSSGTITEGTIRIADLTDVNQSEPIFTLARPAGIAAHVGGSFATSSSSRRGHTTSGASIATRYRFNGSPASSMCAAVSSTAMAMLGAQ